MAHVTITTKHLLLRPWKRTDIAPFARVSASPAVMRYFPSCLTAAQSAALIDQLQHEIDRQGWGVWAIEEHTTGTFVGFTGLRNCNADIPGSPFMEIAWRLDAPFWGKGLAYEAAQAALSYAFDQLGVPCVLAYTARLNGPSIALMKRLGMHDTAQDFLHPALPLSHPLAPHVLYAIAHSDPREAP